MGILGLLFRLVMMFGAVLVGTYVGDFVRDPRQERGNSAVGFMRGSIEGNNVVGLNMRLTNLVPALIVAWLAGPPRLLAAFLGGIVSSTLIGDKLEA